MKTNDYLESPMRSIYSRYLEIYHPHLVESTANFTSEDFEALNHDINIKRTREAAHEFVNQIEELA